MLCKSYWEWNDLGSEEGNKQTILESKLVRRLFSHHNCFNGCTHSSAMNIVGKPHHALKLIVVIVGYTLSTTIHFINPITVLSPILLLNKCKVTKS